MFHTLTHRYRSYSSRPKTCVSFVLFRWVTTGPRGETRFPEGEASCRAGRRLGQAEEARQEPPPSLRKNPVGLSHGYFLHEHKRGFL